MCKAMKWDAEAETGTLDERASIRAKPNSESQAEAPLNEIVKMIESDEQYRSRENRGGAFRHDPKPRASSDPLC